MSKIEIETDLEAFLASIRNWDGATPSFESIVATVMHQEAKQTGTFVKRGGMPTLVGYLTEPPGADGCAAFVADLADDLERKLQTLRVSAFMRANPGGYPTGNNNG